MSMIPTTLGSVAGAPLSQSTSASHGSGTKESAALERRLQTDEKAEHAGGIGETEQDEQTDERDADGRRLWERTAESDSNAADDEARGQLSKDASGETGNSLDLVG